MLTRCGMLVLGALSLAEAGAAQQPGGPARRRVGTTAACTTCIAIGPPLPFQAAAGAPFAQAPVAMTRDSRGWYYLIEEGSEGVVSVLDSARRVVRTLGRPGDGPGEFRVPEQVLLGPRDSVHVIDTRAWRRTVFSPAPEFKYIRRVPLQPSPRLALLGGDRVALNFDVAAGGAMGQPLHLLSPQGTVERSFGAAGPFDPKAHPWIRRRELTRSAAGFWAGHVLDYTVEQWTADGSKLAELYRDPEWFPPRSAPVFTTAETAPSAELAALREDGGGRLWVLIVVPAREWQRGVGTPSVKRGAVVGWTKLDHIPQLLFETVIEVIDPVRGELLATQRVPGLYPYFVGASQIGGYRTGEDQVPVPEVREVSFHSKDK